MDRKPHHGHKWMAIFYMNYFPQLQNVANHHGYALAVHGSITRDLDLVLIPWVDPSTPHQFVIAEMDQVLNRWHDEIGEESSRSWFGVDVEKKPCGRLSYCLPLSGGGWIDLSVTPNCIGGADEITKICADRDAAIQAIGDEGRKRGEAESTVTFLYEALEGIVSECKRQHRGLSFVKIAEAALAVIRKPVTSSRAGHD